MDKLKKDYYSQVKEAKEIYKNSGNISKFLREQFNLKDNTPEIIEIAYDIQAGSYVDGMRKNPERHEKYCSELASYLEKYVDSQTSLMEVGCGESTNTFGIFNKLSNKPKSIIGFDISFSRIKVGLQFWNSELSKLKNINSVSEINHEINSIFFVADLFSIPLGRKSVDVVYTSHSIEPNGGREVEALKNIFRIAKKRVLLFEPYFEGASSEGQKRMSHHGYIKKIPEAITEAGGVLQEIKAIKNIGNPLNPTFLFDIEVTSEEVTSDSFFWSDPITFDALEKQEDCFYGSNSGLAYPIIKGIPCLRPENAIVATCL